MRKSEEEEVERKGRVLYRWGAALTGLYIILQASYAYSEWENLVRLGPDGYADFLAGVFSPLAFLWLVLGFFQQGIELRHNGRALWLQGEELRNSVEHQRDLVDVTRQQLDVELAGRRDVENEKARLRMPILRMNSGGSSHSASNHEFRFILHNSGTECFDVKIQSDHPSNNYSGFVRINHLTKGSDHALSMRFVDQEVEALNIDVEFIDVNGKTHIARFPVAADEGANTPRLTPSPTPIFLTNC